MKKITFFLTSLFFVATAAANARADSYKYSPYVGADYTYDHTTARGISPYHHAANIRIGSDYSRYFATELFLMQSNNNKRYAQGQKIITSYRAYGLDLLAFLPLDSADRFSLLATTGIGEYVYKIREFPENSHNEHGFGYRFGSGFKYALCDHLHLRFVTRYIKFNRLDKFDHAVEYTTGLEYHF